MVRSLQEFVQISYFAISKSYIWGFIEINCISLSNELGAKVFHSLVETIKTENCLSTFLVAGAVNTKIFMSFIKISFYKQTS